MSHSIGEKDLNQGIIVNTNISSLFDRFYPNHSVNPFMPNRISHGYQLEDLGCWVLFSFLLEEKGCWVLFFIFIQILIEFSVTCSKKWRP